jgi:molecular chaperone DnaK (HSP70)
MVASRRSPWLLRPLALVLVCSLLVDFADGRSSGKSKPNKGREKASKAKDSSKKGGKKKPAAKSLDVTIPEGARPGDRLEFVTPDNQQFYTEVPKGMSPGQQMRLQLPKGVRKARMKKFFPPKRRTRKSAGKMGAGKGRGGGASAGPTKPAPTMVGIDFGSEHIKIAVEAPRKDGDPFEDPVVLNMQGGRTTPNVLALQDDEIFFGDVAIPLLPKLPNSSYVHIKQLLGRRMDEPKPFGLAAHTEPSGGPAWFTAMGLHYDFVADENRSTVRLPAGSTTGAGADGPASPRTLGVEELTALTLVKCKELVNARLHSKAGQAGASHFAISVPVWFTKLQRSAMSHAARLAGFENVAIVNDNTALAFKYTLTRNPRDILADKGKDKKARYTNKDTHTVLLYDVGSTGATASLVTINIGTKTKGRKMSVVETIDIRAVAWEERVGGRSFDRRLAQIMARRYNAAERKGGGAADVLADRRAMALLLREAAKTKEKLSANT